VEAVDLYFHLFIKALCLDSHKAIATSLLVTIFTAGSGLIEYLDRGAISIIPAIAAP